MHQAYPMGLYIRPKWLANDSPAMQVGLALDGFTNLVNVQNKQVGRKQTMPIHGIRTQYQIRVIFLTERLDDGLGGQLSRNNPAAVQLSLYRKFNNRNSSIRFAAATSYAVSQ